MIFILTIEIPSLLPDWYQSLKSTPIDLNSRRDEIEWLEDPAFKEEQLEKLLIGLDEPLIFLSLSFFKDESVSLERRLFYYDS